MKLEQIDPILDNDDGKKLVRDLIHKGDPKIWDISEIRVLENDSLFLVALANKNVEESEEIKNAVRNWVETGEDEEIIKELADQLTIIETFLEAKGWTWEDLIKVREKKDERIGRFKLRHFLRSKKRE